MSNPKTPTSNLTNNLFPANAGSSLTSNNNGFAGNTTTINTSLYEGVSLFELAARAMAAKTNISSSTSNTNPNNHQDHETNNDHDRHVLAVCRLRGIDGQVFAYSDNNDDGEGSNYGYGHGADNLGRSSKWVTNASTPNQSNNLAQAPNTTTNRSQPQINLHSNLYNPQSSFPSNPNPTARRDLTIPPTYPSLHYQPYHPLPHPHNLSFSPSSNPTRSHSFTSTASGQSFSGYSSSPSSSSYASHDAVLNPSSLGTSPGIGIGIGSFATRGGTGKEGISMGSVMNGMNNLGVGVGGGGEGSGRSMPTQTQARQQGIGPSSSSSSPLTTPITPNHTQSQSLPTPNSHPSNLDNSLTEPHLHHPTSVSLLTSFFTSLFPHHYSLAIRHCFLLEIVIPGVEQPFIGGVMDLPPTFSSSSRSGGGHRHRSGGAGAGGRTVYICLPPFEGKGESDTTGGNGSGREEMREGEVQVQVHGDGVVRVAGREKRKSKMETSKSNNIKGKEKDQLAKDNNKQKSISPSTSRKSSPAPFSTQTPLTSPPISSSRPSTPPSSSSSSTPIDIRTHLTALLDLSCDTLSATELILVLNREDRSDQQMTELLHALAYVGGGVRSKRRVRGGFEWDERRWVLVGIEL